MKDLVDVINALQPILLVTLTGAVGLFGTLQGIRMERRRIKEAYRGKLFDRRIEGGAAIHGIVLQMLTRALDVINMPLIPDYLRPALSERYRTLLDNDLEEFSKVYFSHSIFLPEAVQNVVTAAHGLCKRVMQDDETIGVDQITEMVGMYHDTAERELGIRELMGDTDKFLKELLS